LKYPPTPLAVIWQKLLRTSNIETVKNMPLQLSFDLPSVIIEKRTKNFQRVSLKLITRMLVILEISIALLAHSAVYILI